MKSLHAAAGAFAIAAWLVCGLLSVANAAESSPVRIRLVLTNVRAHAVALQVDDSAVTVATEGQLVAFGEVRLRLRNVRQDRAAIELVTPLVSGAPHVVLLATGEVYEYSTQPPTVSSAIVSRPVATPKPKNARRVPL